jgi:hypothetical protein
MIKQWMEFLHGHKTDIWTDLTVIRKRLGRNVIALETKYVATESH